jgi:nucleotide-binding universal stress UspA family protein
MIKDIALALEIGSSRDAALDYAVSVAAAFEAHIAAIGFAYEPVMPPIDSVSAVPFDILDAEREESKKAAMAAITRFDEATRRATVSAETRIIEASISGATKVFGSIARSFDLSIVNQANPNSLRDDLMVEGALFDSGRPVLVVPYIQRTGLKLDRVMACWDGSRNAARAINDAMPFLTRAKAIDVTTVGGEQKHKADTIQGADIAHHLARHGLNVELRNITVGDVDVANAILSDAADRDADLIVMGGYGHSRLREFVLGGATRGILSSMTVPTLMAH